MDREETELEKRIEIVYKRHKQKEELKGSFVIKQAIKKLVSNG